MNNVFGHLSTSLLAGAAVSLMTSAAQAADGHEILHYGNIDRVGGETELVQADWVQAGRVPVNDEWVYVYDPNFFFFLTGSTQSGDRTAEFADKGYVVVAAAGNPGGNFVEQPSWFGFDMLSAHYDATVPAFDLSVHYDATWVPTYRGYQSYIVYTNYEQVAAPSELTVYDSDHAVWPRSISGLRQGADNYLLTGDGQEAHATLRTNAPDAAYGPAALEIHTEADAESGTHWKLMLFANGDAASYQGIDVGSYARLELYAKASRPVTLLGGFGSGDDSDRRALDAMELTTEYQKFELDLTGMNLSDINTLLWVYLHKDANDIDFSGVSVFLDNIKLVARDAFVTEDAAFMLGAHVDEQGLLVHTEVKLDMAGTYMSVLAREDDRDPLDGRPAAATRWVVDHAIMHNQGGPLLGKTATVVGFYVQDCATGVWINARDTIYGGLAALRTTVWGGYYDVSHGYANIVSGGLIDTQFACAREPERFDFVKLDDEVVQVASAGRVRFALVVQHR